MEILVVSLLGILAGVLSGLFGLAGGTLLVPGLMILAGVNQLSAIGTSLAGNLLPVGILGVWYYYKKGYICIKAVVILALGLAVGSFLGSFTALNLPPFWLKLTYGLFMAALSLRFFFYNPPETEKLEFPAFSTWGMGLIGMIAGVLSGLFGIGGGAVMVPLLLEIHKFNHKQATATSLGALLLPFSLPAVLHYHSQSQVNWVLAGVLALGLSLGVLLGARLHTSSNPKRVRLGYTLYLGIIGIGFILHAFSP